MALSNKVKAKPAWTQNQQKDTKPKDNDIRSAEASANGVQTVVIKLKTDYRDVAKAGDNWETDREKAEELVHLGRAEYVK
jgi:hypothetical protein